MIRKSFRGGADNKTSLPIYVTRKTADGNTGSLSMPLMQVLYTMLFAFVVLWLWLIVAFIYAFVVLWRLIF